MHNVSLQWVKDSMEDSNINNFRDYRDFSRRVDSKKKALIVFFYSRHLNALLAVNWTENNF